MADSFTVGTVELNGRCVVMTMATDVEPRHDATFLLGVSATLLDPQGEYAMPGPADLADLDAIESQTTASLAPACDFVGRISGSGLRQLLYAASENVAQLDDVLAAIRSAHPARDIRSSSRPDPDHRILNSMIADARRGWQDMEVLKQLQQAGADLSKPRVLDYTLRFPSREAAVRASRGFEDDPWSVRLGDQDEGGEWPLTISQVETAQTDRIAHYNAMFKSVASAEGGQLDGWGAQVAAAREASSRRRLFRRR